MGNQAFEHAGRILRRQLALGRPALQPAEPSEHRHIGPAKVTKVTPQEGKAYSTIADALIVPCGFTEKTLDGLKSSV